MLQDIYKIILEPSSLCSKILLDQNWTLNRQKILFIIFMQIYFFFLPSYLFVLNILVLIFALLNIGFVYCFAQELMMVASEPRDDDDFFYRIAYCFALLQIPALIINIANNALCVIFAKDFLIGIFFSALINFFALALSLIYICKLVSIVTQEKDSLRIVLELIPKSFMNSFVEPLGLRSLREIFEDLRTN